MVVVRLTVALLLAGIFAWSATFGTVVPLVGGAADIVLDEPRGRLYLVNTSQTRIEVYSIPQRRFLSTIRTESLPLSAAMSLDGRFLYVAAHDASSLQVIDLNTLAVTNRVSLPARPEGVAVGGDGRVLISTIGTGAGNAANILLIYDPNEQAARSLTAVGLTPPAPQSPLLPAPSGRIFLSARSRLLSTPDGRLIVGVNIPNNNSRAVFVYEVASGTVLRSRTVINASSTLSVSPDGSRFMAGLTLFDTETLTILAQQNAANAPWPFPAGTNFNTQQTQGGSVFSPNGEILFSAFNVTPVQNPPARPNVSQLMLNDPENLLIQLGLQLAENLAGKMVMTEDGSTIFGLSESGFMILPMNTVQQNPLAIPASTVSLLVNDLCGVYRDNRTQNIAVQNVGRGRMVVQAQLIQQAPTGPGGIGGAGGAGGGAPGGGVVIVVPGAPGGIVVPPGVTLPGGANVAQNAAVANTAPVFRALNTADSSSLDLTFSNAAAARTPGTVAPTHTILLQSDQAINIPPAVRVFQNFRDAESRGELVPIQVGLSASEALEDMVFDATRQRIYIANSGMNRVEIYDTRRRELLPPIKVGQLPRSLAMTPEGMILYVANTGGETISIIDLDRLQVSGRVRFPALPFNSGAAAMTPSVIAAGLRGLQILMNNGTIWRVVGGEAVPRPLSPAIGTTTIPAPRTMAATPNGEYIMLLAGNGFVYLYDSVADEYVQGRQIFSNPIQGFYGPIAAGPRGQYFLANGTILNQSLTPVANAGTTIVPGPVRPGQQPPTTVRPISAVASASGSTFVRMAQPVRANANALAAERPSVELVDVNSGQTLRSGLALEGPISTLVGNARSNINGRTMAVDGTGSTVYALTTSGLSILPLGPLTIADRPTVNQGGTVSLSSYTAQFAPGSLVTVFGQRLGSDAAMSAGPASTLMGGVCVTLNNIPMPLLMTSAGQINAQIPTELAAGRYPMIIRNIERRAPSLPVQLTVTKYAPALFTDTETKEVLLFRRDGSRVTSSNPARRDESLMLFATGLGVTKGPRIASGTLAPASPLAETDPVEVYFGDPRYSQSEMIVDWAGLVPGFVGLYQINIRVPGERMRGDSLPVTLRIGGVESQKTGPVVPVVAVQ